VGYLAQMPSRRVRRRSVAADDLYQLRFVADAQISPDGEHVAYIVAWVDGQDRTRYRSQLMLKVRAIYEKTSFLAVVTCGSLPRATRPGPRVV
jgi:dipeptidyl aminopeptidase/acylaminoacyl peptidase